MTYEVKQQLKLSKPVPHCCFTLHFPDIICQTNCNEGFSLGISVTQVCVSVGGARVFVSGCLSWCKLTVPNKENIKMHHFLSVIQDFFFPRIEQMHTAAVYWTGNVNSWKSSDCCTSMKGTAATQSLCKNVETVHYNRDVAFKLGQGEELHLWSKCSLCCVKQDTTHPLTTTPPDSHTYYLFM